MEEVFLSNDDEETSEVAVRISDKLDKPHDDEFDILFELSTQYAGIDVHLTKEEFKGILKAMLRFDERL
jgi:hypothetical protein